MAAAPPPPPQSGFAFTPGSVPGSYSSSLFAKPASGAFASSITSAPVAAAPVAATATNPLYKNLAAVIQQQRNKTSLRPTASSAANNAAPPPNNAGPPPPPLLALRHDMSIVDPISNIVNAAHQQCSSEIQLSKMSNANRQSKLHTLNENFSIFKIFLEDRDKAKEYIHDLLVFYEVIQENAPVTKDAIMKYLQEIHTQEKQQEFADFLKQKIKKGGRRKHRTRHNKKQRKQRKYRRTRKY